MLLTETSLDATFSLVNTNGIRLRVAQAGSGPLIVLVHGWPESWYSWRHPIAALAAGGPRGGGPPGAPRGCARLWRNRQASVCRGLLDQGDVRRHRRPDRRARREAG